MKTSIVFSDIKKMPPLSTKRIAEIEAFQDREDADNPEWSQEDWKNARPAFGGVSQTNMYAEIDRDILDWLSQDGQDCRERLNAALRFAMNNGF